MRVLKDNFKPDQPVSAVGCEWFNAVAKFINKLTGSRGVVVDRSGEFPKVSLISPTSAPTSDKVLTCKSGDMDLTWEDGGCPACPNDTTAESAATVAARHPLDVLATPATETDAQKQAREISDIGTSSYAARADHRHRWPNDTSTASAAQGPEQVKTTTDSFFYLRADHWDKGTYTSTASATTDDVGITFLAITGGKGRSDGMRFALKFRKITVNRYGVITNVGPEQSGYDVDLSVI